jgi:hypothetical protein
MDLALLVYAISLLHGFGVLGVTILTGCGAAIFFFGMWFMTETDEKSYYSPQLNKQRKENGVMCKKYMTRAFWVGVATSVFMIFLPTEKTAYTMVGAYAAQKVAENDKVQQMSGKVLTIIEQKLDNYIEEGIQQAQEKEEKKSKRK